MANNHTLTDAERGALLARLQAWQAACDYSGDLLTLDALRYRLQVPNLSAADALEAVTLVRRSIGRLPKAVKPSRTGSVTRRL